MKILVTGAAGYVGTELVSVLAKKPDIEEIVLYDNLSRRNHNLFMGAQIGGAHLRFINGDILDTRRLKQALKDIDVVYHLAARVTTPFADAEFHGLEQVNHWGSAELSYALEEQPIKRVIYLSSTSVYGSAEDVDLETVPTPVTAYGISKLNGERMLARLSDRMDVYILRCANVYGYSRSMRFDAVINRFLFEAHFNGRISIQGSGTQKRAFIHINHVAQMLAQCAAPGLAPGCYNLVERNLSVGEIATALTEIYPQLERIYLEQDMGRRNLSVRPDLRLVLEPGDFIAQLRDFSARFSF